MDSANNVVVAFPSSRMVRAPVVTEDMTVQEIKSVGEANKLAYAASIADDVTADVFMKIAMAGFNPADDSLLKDSMFVYEAVKSLMLKAMGMPHSIQKMADRMMQLPAALKDVLAEDEMQ